MRIALFTLEALANAQPVRRFVAAHAADIAFVGLSDAERPSMGGMLGQVRRHLGRSGPGFLPYIAINFGLADLAALLAPLTQRLAATQALPETTPLRTLCSRLGLPWATIADVNGPETREHLRRSGAALIVSFHFDQIFSADTLALAPQGGLNVHPGLLPRHRGPVPTIHALRETPAAFGVTVHRLVPEIDAGAILDQRAVTLPPRTTASRASTLLHEAGRFGLDRVLEAASAAGALPPGEPFVPGPYCPFPKLEEIRDMQRRGLSLVDGRDAWDALTLCARVSIPGEFSVGRGPSSAAGSAGPPR